MSSILQFVVCRCIDVVQVNSTNFVEKNGQVFRYLLVVAYTFSFGSMISE